MQFFQPRTLYSLALQKQKSSGNPVILFYLLICGFLEELTGEAPSTPPKDSNPRLAKRQKRRKPPGPGIHFTSVLADHDTM